MKTSELASTNTIYFHVFRGDYGKGGKSCDINSDVSDVGMFTLSKVSDWVQSHVTQSAATPFVQVTSDLLRAISDASERQSQTRASNFRIAVIDGSKLNPGEVVECNKLLHWLGERKEDRYDSEHFVWKRIPQEAVAITWTVNELRAGIAKMYDTSKYPEPLETALDNFSGKETPTMGNVVKTLGDTLNVPPSAMVLKQLAMIIMAWSKGENLTSEYAAAHNYFRKTFPKETKDLDVRAYAQAYHEYLHKCLAYTPKGTEHNGIAIGISLDMARKYPPPTFEEWENRCAEEEMRVRKPSDDSFVALLERAGLVISLGSLLGKLERSAS